jgi:hypothetical protein
MKGLKEAEGYGFIYGFLVAIGSEFKETYWQRH